MSKKNQTIMIVSDAWHPQVNGVVRTLSQTREELIRLGYDVFMLTHEGFNTIPCPTYPEIRLSVFSATKVAHIIRNVSPNFLHIATEGPLGLAARNFAIRNAIKYTSAYHTRFPEYIQSRTGIPLGVTYSFLRWFHKPSKALLAPTKTVFKDLSKRGIGKPKLWPRGVDLKHFTPDKQRKKNLKHIFIYVGRVAVEKNLCDFLDLELDGEKWVVGDGPALAKLKIKYHDVVFHGVKTRDELPEFYQKADVLVFPSKTDTFGLVMLEAMACGLPVAAFPTTGPIDVVGDSEGGVLHNDLAIACDRALKKSRDKVRAYAENFSWRNASEIFLSHLVPIRTPMEPNLFVNVHKTNSVPLRTTTSIGKKINL
jgi:glycosyltransferase involved in cell wall biosynthesis